MKDMVKKAGLDQAFQIESAATSTEEIGNPVYPPCPSETGPAWDRMLREDGPPISKQRLRKI